ncbi:MAG TPA: hypothetical protein VFF81_03620 [Noviherbaspirillum sp.]|nr:hypothetical protein [Noviherbaspirillum sp.]
MLTATYSLVAIAAEQDTARSRLDRLQKYIHSAWKSLQNIDFGFIENALNKLMQFDKYCRTRKIEMYLIPALRNATREADTLVEELDALSSAATNILRSIGEQLTATFFAGRIRFSEICQAMDLYCRKLAMRLEREEQELLPMARSHFSTEEWFSIAAQFLSDETTALGRRRKRRPAHRMAVPIGSRMVNVRS